MIDRWVGTVASALLVLNVHAGLVALGLRTLIVRGHLQQRIRRGLLLAVPLVVPLPFQWLDGRTGLWLVGQAGGVMLLALICSGRRGRVAAGFLWGLAALLVLGFSSEGVRSRLLTTANASVVEQMRGISKLDARAMYWSVAKEWKADPGTTAVELGFEVRLAEGTPGLDWYRYSPQLSVNAVHATDSLPFTRVRVPEGGVTLGLPNLSRELDTGDSLAGRTFRLLASLRSARPLSTTGCTGLVLQENGGRYRGACEPVSLDSQWRQYVVEWTAPPDVTGSELRVLVADIPADYDIGNVKVEERIGGAWRDVGALEPSGLQISARKEGASRNAVVAHTIVPGAAWQRHSVILGAGEQLEDGILRVNFQVEGFIGLELRALTMTQAGGERTPLAPVREERWALGFGQPNLLGHSVAMVGASIGFLARPPLIQGAGLLLAFIIVLASGSRAAALALLLAAFVLFATARRGRTGWLLLALFSLSVALAVVLLPNAFERLMTLVDGNTVPRSEIWAVAWGALAAHPFTGLGEASFGAYWAQTTGGWPSSAPSHAHNFVLQFAAHYGVPGVVAALGFLGVLAWLCWKQARWRGLVLLVPALTLNWFDFTLFFPGIMGPLLLALDANRTDSGAR